MSMFLLLFFLGCSTAPPPTHTVVRGDTLSKLAKTHGCTVSELREWNGISGDLIEVGQVLVVGSAEKEVIAAPPPALSKRPKQRKRSKKKSAKQSPKKAPALSMPVAKDCLQLSDSLDAERGMIASKGLSQAQIQDSLEGFFPQLSPCLDTLTQSGRLQLELTVGCDGRVKQIEVLSQSIDAASAGCLTTRLKYAPFPAHGLPSGDVFEYPLVLEAPSDQRSIDSR